MIEHCKKYLTGYKIPKFVEFIDEIPKSNVGKILRRKLREKEIMAKAVIVGYSRSPFTIANKG